MCGHNHSDSAENNCSHHSCNHEEKTLIRIWAAAVVLTLLLILKAGNTVGFLLYTAVYIIAGGDILYSAIRNIIKGHIFDENFLMSIATIGAFCIGEYPEAVCVMILYQAGEYLQHKAVENSRSSITKLMDLRPEYANTEQDGILIRKKPEEIAVNDIIIVKSGEKVPLDGKIIEGHSYIDTSSLTGESVLKEVQTGNEVLSGVINKSGVLRILVTKAYEDSAVSKILELVENAGSKKSRTENFITRFAKYYTPIVVVLALLFVLIPLISGITADISILIKRALTFLVISCPCALVISIPLTFFSGIGAASKQGILIKGSNYLETVANTGIIVFDKTGTLTKGTFKVTKVMPENGITRDELTEYAAKAETYSNHPIAVSIKEAYGKEIECSKITEVEEIAGKGVKASVNGAEILAGNEELMKKFNIEIKTCSESGTVVYIAKDKIYCGYIVVSDEIKENAKEVINKIQNQCIKTIMLTGDSIKSAEETAKKTDIKEFFAELLPVDKVNKLEEIIKNKTDKRSTLFAGDGINDAPVLMRADAGIAMGALGSDAAIEAADIVITDDNLDKINTAVNIAKKTMIIVKENIIFAIGIKVIFLILGAFGLMTMWGAVFADVGVTLIAVANSLRTLKINF